MSQLCSQDLSVPRRAFLDSGGELRKLFGPATITVGDLAQRAEAHAVALEDLDVAAPIVHAVRSLAQDVVHAFGDNGRAFRAIVGHYLRQLRALEVLPLAHDEPPETTLARLESLRYRDAHAVVANAARRGVSHAYGGYAPSPRASEIVRRARPADATPANDTDETLPGGSPAMEVASNISLSEGPCVGPAWSRSRSRLIVLEPSASSRNPVRVFSSYRIDPNPIGMGGASRVFRAWDADTFREVAIKIVTIPDDSHRAMSLSLFQHERELQGSVACQSIVESLKAGLTGNGEPYLVMELLSGGSLADYLDAVDHGTRPFSLDEAKRIGAMSIAAVAAAHRRGIIHKDVKPENFLFTEDLAQLKLGDFGVADRKGQDGFEICGTVGYIPPETLESIPDDETRDVFALGVVLYELLTGVMPFPHENVAVAYRAMKQRAPMPPSECRPHRQIGAALDRVVLTALSAHREDRYADADALLADFASAEIRAELDEATRARDAVRARGDKLALDAADATWIEAARLALRRLERATESFPGERLRAARVEIGAELLELADRRGDQPLFREATTLVRHLEPRNERLAAVSDQATATFVLDDPRQLARAGRVTYTIGEFDVRSGIFRLRNVDKSARFTRTLEYERGSVLGVGIEGPGLAPVFVPLPSRLGAHTIRIPIYANEQVPASATIITRGASIAWSRYGSYVAQVDPADTRPIARDFALSNLVTVREFLAFREDRGLGELACDVDCACLDAPVRGLSLARALDYLDWLEGRLDGAAQLTGVRLPTLPEMKHACRGDDARAFPWGDALPTSTDVAAFQYAGFRGAMTLMPSVPDDPLLADRSPFSVPSGPRGFHRVAYHLAGNVSELLGLGATAEERAPYSVFPALAGFDPREDNLSRRFGIVFGGGHDRPPPTTIDIVQIEEALGHPREHGFRWAMPLRHGEALD
ncbi:MAG: protein kinase [Polyangiales bacterium]